MGRNSGRFRQERVSLYLTAKETLQALGAASVGIAVAGAAADNMVRDFSAWLDKGYNADMEWMHRHNQLRSHTDFVLPEAKTIICAAFPYGATGERPPYAEQIASYACRADYHDVLRSRMREAAGILKQTFGGKWRVCIDSAPIAERYWALRSGVGVRGRNGCVIVPGVGSCVFLAELLTDIETDTTDTPSTEWCIGCGMCVKSCPTGALRCDGSVDARRCLSYLTIEKRGEFTDEEKELVRKGQSLFGCDICQRVCPHNRMSRTEAIDCFRPISDILNLTAAEAAEITDEDFSSRFASTPLNRCGAEGLRRNARALLDCSQHDKEA